jgi:AraC-like DNA-binding protein
MIVQSFIGGFMNFQNTFQRGERPGQTMLSCYCYHGDKHGEYPLHCHSYYEISFILSGSRTETVNNNHYKLRKNSLLFIPPLSIHDLHNITPVKDIVVQFTHGFINNIAPSLNDQLALIPVNSHDNSYHFRGSQNIRQIFSELCDIITAYEKNTLADDIRTSQIPTSKILLEFRISALCIRLLLTLLEEGVIMLTDNSASYEEIESLDPVINELLRHPEQKLDMRKASKMVGMSYSHFSRIFPKITGFPYHIFCNQLRIRKAEELLLATDMSISDISDAIGVETLSYFTRLFKQYTGMSPSKYRSKYSPYSHS